MDASGIRGTNQSGDSQEDDQQAMMEELRRGPWTVEEDLTLINYIANHGDGRWNSLARSAGNLRIDNQELSRFLVHVYVGYRR